MRDRAHPLDAYDDVDFKSRYRLRRATVMDIIDVITDDIQSGHDGRNQDLTPTLKTLLALRFYATGSFQTVAGDLHGVSTSAAHNAIHDVSRAIAGRKGNYIFMPRRENLARLKRDFFAVDQFPHVIGAIDCTHIRIKNPDALNGARYMNRKGFYSLNVQVMCDANMRITNIVARWPGSSHDSRILQNSRLSDTLTLLRRDMTI